MRLRKGKPLATISTWMWRKLIYLNRSYFWSIKSWLDLHFPPHESKWIRGGRTTVDHTKWSPRNLPVMNSTHTILKVLISFFPPRLHSVPSLPISVSILKLILLHFCLQQHRDLQDTKSLFISLMSPGPICSQINWKGFISVPILHLSSASNNLTPALLHYGSVFDTSV